MSDSADRKQELIRAASLRWSEIDQVPERTLLRLSVLRELLRALHAEKSRLLATGKKPEAQAIRPYEARIEELRGCAPLDGDLPELLDGRQTLKKRTKILPSGLLQAIDAEKLERHDRKWEARIAAEACDLGWKFWSLEAWVEIAKVEQWNAQAESRLWPGGLVLFTESASPPPPAAVEEWHGRWVCVIHPRYPNPGEMPLDWVNWPGTPARAPSPPAWKLLFSPRAR